MRIPLILCTPRVPHYISQTDAHLSPDSLPHGASGAFGGFVAGSIGALFSDMLGDRMLGVNAQVPQPHSNTGGGTIGGMSTLIILFVILAVINNLRGGGGGPTPFNRWSRRGTWSGWHAGVGGFGGGFGGFGGGRSGGDGASGGW